MNANTAMILLIVTLIITVGGVVIFQEYSQTLRNAAESTFQGTQNEQKQANNLNIVSVVGTQTSSDGYQYVHFQVRNDGAGNLSLNDTYIQIATDKSTADLTYRNGTLTRDINTGFYTQ